MNKMMIFNFMGVCYIMGVMFVLFIIGFIIFILINFFELGLDFIGGI